MKDGKIIVTGSSGLIGKELVQHSLKGEQLILVDQDPPAQSMDNFLTGACRQKFTVSGKK